MPRLRPARRADGELLRALLFEAVHWRSGLERPPLEETLGDPALARYVEDFGRPGDFGVIAEEAGEPLGAAWWRWFGADAPGYGFVDEATPELSIALFPGHRGQGIGTMLLEALEREARRRGIERLSLSVERDNPAVALYERFGFRPRNGEGNAVTMLLELGPPG